MLRLALPDIAYLDPQQITDLSSSRVANVDLRRALSVRLPRDAGARRAEYRGGDARDLGRRPHLDDPDQARNPFATLRRSKASRASSSRRTTSIRSRAARPQFSSAAAIPRSRTCWTARGRVIDAAKKFGKLDYDAKIEGLQAIDRHTLRSELTAVDYTVLERLAQLTTSPSRVKWSKRRADTSWQPVGTGPFRLREWMRGSRVVLEANPGIVRRVPRATTRRCRR